MSTDWAFALKVGAVGFGLVFVILIILYLALWVIGWVSAKLTQNKAHSADKKAEAQVGGKSATISG